MSDSNGAGTNAVRKQVTVLFCDIANFTERASQMDPEDLAEEIHSYQNICADITASYQGHIWSYLGDGVMVLFGYPEASEFSPERAVRAGLEMVSAIKQNNLAPAWQDKKPLTIRVGIATGLMVVGGAARSYQEKESIYGNASTLADRLQSIALPNTVVVSNETRDLVGLAFKFRDLGEQLLKGYQQPIRAWQILSERKLQKRPGNTLIRSTSKFVSRESELKDLVHHFRKASKGITQCVHVHGEPGIGKTRLVRNFIKSIGCEDYGRMRISCSPYYQKSFLKPVSEECFRWLEISDDDPVEKKQKNFYWAMQEAGVSDVINQQMLAEFFDIPIPLTENQIDIAPEERRRIVIDTLVSIIISISRINVLMLVAEDLHWADSSTLELLNVLMKSARRERLMVVLTSRQNMALEWPPAHQFRQIGLCRFNHFESRQLVEGLLQQHSLPPALKRNIVDKSDGVPLYLEEACSSVINFVENAGEQQLDSYAYPVPETLQDSLNARLDQLQQAKPLAQLASCFGESFDYAMISEVARLNEIEVDRGMDLLLSENILMQEEDMIEPKMKFNHVMFKEAAYQSLLIKSRQHFHQQIADLYLTRNRAALDKTPELVAYHLTQAKSYQSAIDLWIKAGQNAIEKAAVAEAIDHLHQGLGLISNTDNGPAQQERELILLLHLGVSLTARGGYFGEAVNQTYQRAATLARQLGDDEREWTALYGLWRCLISQANYSRVLRMSVRLTALCDKLQQPVLDLTATGIKALQRMVDGKFVKADKLNNRSLAFYNDVNPVKFGLRFGQDPIVTIKGLGAVVKLIIGEVELSKRHLQQSLTNARATGHPYTIAETLKVAAMYAHVSGDMVELRRYAEEAIEISARYGFDGILATHQIFLTCAELSESTDESLISVIEENLQRYSERYGLLFLPYFRSFLASANLQLGNFETAFSIAQSINEDIDRCGEYWVRAVALFLQGESACLGKLVTPAVAAQWYLQALETASTQGAKWIVHRFLKRGHIFDIPAMKLAQYEKEVSFLTEHAEVPVTLSVG